MKTEVERRKPQGIKDYFSLAMTTFGVGYLPLAPGTWGSMVGVAIYLGVAHLAKNLTIGLIQAVILVSILLFSLLGIWASNRAIPLLGNEDPSQAVIDEVIGQLIVFLFVPFAISWSLVLAGFILFRLFDIWKPYPIRSFEVLPGGLGICADDIVAGIYGGICLSVIYAVVSWF